MTMEDITETIILATAYKENTSNQGLRESILNAIQKVGLNKDMEKPIYLLLTYHWKEILDWSYKTLYKQLQIKGD